MLTEDIPDTKFFELVEILRPMISPDMNSPNYRSLSTEKKIAVVLYYFKGMGSLWMTANTFGIHQCTVSKIIMEVSNAINPIMGPQFLHLPKSVNDMQETVSEFEQEFGIIQAFGCIDGTHVEIKRPIENSQDYFCYKQYFSLNIQAICNTKGKFIDIDCRRPGSVHDAKVFSNSTIMRKFREGSLAGTLHDVLPGYGDVPNYLIADPAYPMTLFCMKEYHSCSNNQQVIFNNMLRRARNTIECAVGRLKAQWGLLRKTIDMQIETVPKHIYSCFVLHTFCEQNNRCEVDEEEVQV